MKTENKPNNIDLLIASYLSDQLCPEDLSELQQWIDASLENKQYFSNQQTLWLAAVNTSTLDCFDKNKAYSRFLIRTEDARREKRRTKSRLSLRLFWSGAAAVMLLIATSYISYWQGEEGVKTRFSDITVESPIGSKTKIYLPDGTLVWLNAGSKITYSQGFGVSERTVCLTGEGYFEVTKNEKVAFAVKTDELTVNVLGTKFNFRNYNNDNEATVSLVEGNVLASNNLLESNKVKLFPNQKVHLNKRTGKMWVSKVNAYAAVEWTNDYLFFDEERLPNIIKELERNYDVKITLADKSLETFRFYGGFKKSDCNIEDILGMLASTHKIKYKVDGKNIELSAK